MGYRSALRAQGLEFHTREQWGAVHNYADRPPVHIPGSYLFLHISITQDPDDLAGHEDDRMRTLERIGTARFKSGISYNWAVFDTGRQWEGQPLDRKGTHTVNDKHVPGYPYNLNYHGFAVVLPQLLPDEVTDEQVDGVARFGAACRRARLTTATEFLPHQMFANKTCPGAKAMRRLPEINRLMAHYVRAGLGAPDQEDPDMLDAERDYEAFRTMLHRAIHDDRTELGRSDVDVAEALERAGGSGTNLARVEGKLDKILARLPDER